VVANVSRRGFFLSALGSLPAFGAQASDRIRIAVIGVHGRGRDHIHGFNKIDGVEVAAICDPDEEVLRSRAAGFSKRPITETDLRRILDRKDIDAVSIATPNHWHALAAIWACQAGKDVYVEKPGAHTLFEGRKLIEAAAKYDRIVQHGVQLRSSPAIQEAVQLMQKGVIGEVTKARGLVYRNRSSIGHKADMPAPSTLNYDLWQGPAQPRPFNPNIVHYNWHWRWAYGDGEVGNQGIHETDMCMWGLGALALPTKVSTSGKKVYDDDKETPDVLSARYEFGNGKQIEMEMRPWTHDAEEGTPVGNIFFGKEGILLVRGYDEFKVMLGPKREPGPRRKQSGNHFANFIDAVRARKRSIQNGPVETAHLASGLAHMANISYRLQRDLQFDPECEQFESDAEANRLVTRDYRAPFIVPARV
jgi:predicted dehydrogenase